MVIFHSYVSLPEGSWHDNFCAQNDALSTGEARKLGNWKAGWAFWSSPADFFKQNPPTSREAPVYER